MPKILIATTNPGKFGEIVEVLAGLPYEFLSLADLGITADADETGETYGENAEIKARFFAEISGLPTVGEDSGIEVSALASELGVKTRRWGAGAAASDEEWLSYFMQRMERESDRSARFVCAVAFFDGSTVHHFEGSCTGEFATEVLAPLKKGIPLSSIFVPTGCTKVFAELTPEEKASVSHRGRGVGEFRKFLGNSLAFF